MSIRSERALKRNSQSNTRCNIIHYVTLSNMYFLLNVHKFQSFICVNCETYIVHSTLYMYLFHACTLFVILIECMLFCCSFCSSSVGAVVLECPFLSPACVVLTAMCTCVDQKNNTCKVPMVIHNLIVKLNELAKLLVRCYEHMPLIRTINHRQTQWNHLICSYCITSNE